MIKELRHEVKARLHCGARARRGVRALALGTAVGALSLTAQPVMAQVEAASADASEQGLGLEEVVVSAQYRETSLQQTPLAITAVTAGELESRNLTNIAEVGATVPNVNFRVATAAFGRSTTAYIRGVGQGDFNYAYEPAVGMYIDDVYHSTLFGSVFDLLDLERVEILRGPQGTLFGKNSLGGAVRLISKVPKGTGEAYIEGTYGAFDRVDLRAGVDLPLIADHLFLRLSGAAKRRDGYQDKVDFVCENPTLAGSLPSQVPGPNIAGKECVVGTYGGEDVQGIRAALRWVANDRLEAGLTADFTSDNSEAQANTLVYVDPAAPQLVRLNNNVNLPNFGIPYDERFLTGDMYKTYATFTDLVRGVVLPETSPLDSWGVTGTLQYSLTDAVQLKSITAYRTYEGTFSYDQDGSPLQIQNLVNDLSHEQFSQEVRITGLAFGDRLDYTAGAFYFESNSRNEGAVQINYTTLDFLQKDKFDTENKSAFLHAVYSLSDNLGLTTGIRYTDETKSYNFNHPPFLVVPEPQTVSYSRTDWRVGLDYNLTEDLMLYTQASTGFRSGGFNPRPFSAAQLVGFGPEELTAYELGLKSELFDRRVRVNVAAFYSDYKDRIVSIQSVDADGLPFSRPTNIGTAEIQGFEVEMEARPIENLLINGSVGYADFEAKELPGLQQSAVPEWTANGGLQYSLNLGGAGTLTPRLDWYYQSEVFYDTRNNPLSATPGRSLLNARLTWDTADGDWSVALSGTNLTDKEYYINKFYKLNLGQGTIEGQPGRPLEWALTVRRVF